MRTRPTTPPQQINQKFRGAITALDGHTVYERVSCYGYVSSIESSIHYTTKIIYITVTFPIVSNSSITKLLQHDGQRWSAML